MGETVSPSSTSIARGARPRSSPVGLLVKIIKIIKSPDRRVPGLALPSKGQYQFGGGAMRNKLRETDYAPVKPVRGVCGGYTAALHVSKATRRKQR